MITKEQFNNYINENWNEHFYLALAECLRKEMFSNASKEDREEYKNEIKRLVKDGISDGVKYFLDENFDKYSECLAIDLAKKIKINMNVNFDMQRENE